MGLVTTAFTLITPGLFADLRVPRNRLPSLFNLRSLGECTECELLELARTQSFAGFHVVRYDVTDYEGDPVCERLTCIDSQPPPRRFPNQWRIETNWAHGGWLEWGARKDSHGQALYVEHWKRLPNDSMESYVAL